MLIFRFAPRGRSSVGIFCFSEILLVQIVHYNRWDHSLSKIGFNRKPELLYKYVLENADVVLLVKEQHRLFVFDGIYRSKGDWTVLIGDQNGVANYPGRSFVAIIECLDVG